MAMRYGTEKTGTLINNSPYSVHGQIILDRSTTEHGILRTESVSPFI